MVVTLVDACSSGTFTSPIASATTSGPATSATASSGSGTIGPSTAWGEDVELAVAGGQGLIVSEGRLYRVASGAVDSGHALPSGASAPAIASDGQRLAVAAVTGPGIVSVWTSNDIGGSWSAAGKVTMPTASGIGGVSLAMAGTRLVVLAEEVSSSNFSLGMVAFSDDDGKTWSVGDAPSGGQVAAADGLFWLIGGVVGREVDVSPAGHAWTAVKVPAGGPDWSAALPMQVAGLGTVLPVTIQDQTRNTSTVVLLGTTDGGAAWQTLVTQPAPGAGVGATVAAWILADGRWIVIPVDGATVAGGHLEPRTTSVVKPQGLAAGVLRVVMVTDDVAIALATPGACPSGKLSCSTTNVVETTSDGGATWNVLHH